MYQSVCVHQSQLYSCNTSKETLQLNNSGRAREGVEDKK